ncbi:MAG: hypothetical protein LBK41_09000 [Clostridiales bacterium]|jgi:ribosomal-protein-alanine N-acetyltransferase|nr:hypothetical protein [Clostridiales bacterium]
MKIVKHVLVRKAATVKIYCNKCGGEIERRADGIFDDHLGIVKRWGYLSPTDGETHSFDMCRKCYDEMLGGFSIPPSVEKGG